VVGRVLIMQRAYATTGITTLRGVWILLSVFVFLGLNVVVLYAVRTHAYVPASLAGFWVICVAVGSCQTLRTLTTLDPNERATQLAFQLATLQPICGIVPVILLMLP